MGRGRRHHKRKAKPLPVSLGPIKARVARGPRVDGRYYWRISKDGKADGCHWATVGEIAEELGRRLAGVPVEKKEDPKAPKTLGALCRMWLTEQLDRTDIEQVSATTFANSVIRLLTVVDDWKLKRVKHRLHEFRDFQLRTGFSANSVRYDYKVLRRIMKYGALRDWCSETLPRIPVKGPEPDRCTPTAEESDRIAAQLQSELRMAYEILRVTGCRGIALDRLTWEDVNLNASMLKLTGKGRKRRKVPIPPHLVEGFRCRWNATGQRCGSVFQGEVRGRLRTKVQRLCRREGIEPYGLHGLRRLRVREYRRGNVPVKVAAALLGHSPEVMLRMYDEASEEDKRAALEVLWRQEQSATSLPFSRGPDAHV